MPADELARTLAQLGVTLDSASLESQTDLGATIRPTTPSPMGGTTARLLGSANALAGRLDERQVLAVGGMGVVSVATQTSLGRKIAVKALRDERRSEPSARALLYEAWI